MAVVDEAFESVPGVEESDAGVVEDLALGVSGVLVVAGLEGEGGVDDVAVGVVDLESFATGVEGGFDAFGAVVGVPEFGGDKEVFAPGGAGVVGGLHGFADGFFVAVAFGTIKMAESDFEGALDSLPGDEGVGDEGAEADGGDGAGAVGEGDSGPGEGVGGWHGGVPLCGRGDGRLSSDTGSVEAIGGADSGQAVEGASLAGGG